MAYDDQIISKENCGYIDGFKIDPQPGCIQQGPQIIDE